MDSAVKWTDVVSAMATSFGAVGTLAGLLFLAVQIRNQSRAFAEQDLATSENLRLLSERLAVEGAIGSLQFNGYLTTSMNKFLCQIASDGVARDYVWGSSSSGPEAPESRLEVVYLRSLIDDMSLALQACELLPSFRRNRVDWWQYVLDTMYASDKLHEEVASSTGRAYWPEFAPILVAFDSGIRDAREVACNVD